MGEEIIILIMVIALIGLMPIIALILSIIALVHSRRVKTLTRRVEELEARLRPAVVAPEIIDAEAVGVPELAAPGIPAPASARPPIGPSQTTETPLSETFSWETFLGQKALGWTAVVLLVFSATFFLRYAYQNNWIGPIGRVAIGELAGTLLVLAGWRSIAHQRRVLAPMLLAAGIIILYLATYSAFGFYHLLPQSHAGVFLTLLIAESMLLAVLGNAPIVAWTALIGGLATPLLMRSDHDSYVALFSYLAILNAGVSLAISLRKWPGLGSLALIGTQVLFWAWYQENYHPEKLPWALGFQTALFVIYLFQDVLRHLSRARPAHIEDLARLVLNAILWFFAFYQLNRQRYGEWMGTSAVTMAAIYTGTARLASAGPAGRPPQLLVSLAVAIGFLAWALPLQARAPWVALGWSTMGFGLWWFGVRIRVPALRLFAAALAIATLMRFFGWDLPPLPRERFTPLLNEFALPALGVAVCFVASAGIPGWLGRRVSLAERVLVSLAGLAGILLVWLVLTLDCYGYFDRQARDAPSDLAPRARWLGQLSLSVLWSLYASILLGFGFRFDIARLRWVAMGLFAITATKVFLLDMANLEQIYRVLAFFILAVVLGLAAFAYQHFRPRLPTARQE